MFLFKFKGYHKGDKLFAELIFLIKRWTESWKEGKKSISFTFQLQGNGTIVSDIPYSIKVKYMLYAILCEEWIEDLFQIEYNKK